MSAREGEGPRFGGRRRCSDSPSQSQYEGAEGAEHVPGRRARQDSPLERVLMYAQEIVKRERSTVPFPGTPTEKARGGAQMQAGTHGRGTQAAAPVLLG